MSRIPFRYFVYAGLAFLLVEFVLAFQTRSFSSTTGTIRYNNVVYRSTRRRTNSMEYSFERGDTTYFGRRVWRTWWRPTLLTKSLWGRYQPGQTVTVYYNPKNPGDAVLSKSMDPDFAAWCLGITLFGVLFTTVSSRVTPQSPLLAYGLFAGLLGFLRRRR